MKRMTRLLALLLSLVLALPAFAEQAGTDDTPSFFDPMVFGEMYNTLLTALAERYFAEDAAQIREDYTFMEDDGDGPILYLDSKDNRVEASFLFPDENFETGQKALLMNFSVSRDIPSQMINLTVYTLKTLIGYEYRDTVSMDDLTVWFDNLDNPPVFELPGCTLNLIITGDRVQYALLPPGGYIPDTQQDSGSAEEPFVKEEIRFAGLEWGCDMKTAKLKLQLAGLLTRDGEERFEMMERVRSLSGRMGGGQSQSFTSFTRSEHGAFTLQQHEEASSAVIIVPLMSGMVKPYLERDIHHIELAFLVDDATEKLINVNISYYLGGRDVLPDLVNLYGEPKKAGSERDFRIWIGENQTGLMWEEASLNYGLLNALDLVREKEKN